MDSTMGHFQLDFGNENTGTVIFIFSLLLLIKNLKRYHEIWKIIDFKETQLTFAFSALWNIEWSYRMLKWVAFL